MEPPAFPQFVIQGQADRKLTMAARSSAGDAHFSPALVEAALHLKTRGYCCIESVISPKESERYIDRCWSWLESLGTGKLLIFKRQR